MLKYRMRCRAEWKMKYTVWKYSDYNLFLNKVLYILMYVTSFFGISYRRNSEIVLKFNWEQIIQSKE